MSLNELQQNTQSRAFLLTIGGLTVRFYSGAAPASATVPNTGGAMTFTDVEAIVHVSNQMSALDPAKGIAEEGGVNVRLATRGALETSSDPARQLLRVGWRGASRYATLSATLAHATGGGATVEVDRDVSGWDVPGLVHVGAEAIYVTGTAGSGTDVDPYRFTGCTRAAANTRPQAHIVDTDNSRTPLVTQEVVNWRTRWALLQVANRRPDGSLGDYVDVVRGFLEASPVIEDDGAAVVLTIMPNSALLSMKIGGQLAHVDRPTTHLVQGYHHSDGANAVTVEHKQLWRRGEAFFSGQTGAVTNANAGQINFGSNQEDRWANVFDGALTAPHPRNGRIAHPTNGKLMEGAGVGAGFITLQDINDPPVQISDSAVLSNAQVVERVALDVHAYGTDQIVRWPYEAVAAINDSGAAQSWNPGTHTGNNGQWCDVRLEAFSPEGPRLSCRMNVSGTPGLLRLYFYAHVDRRILWYPIDFRHPSDSSWFDSRIGTMPIRVGVVGNIPVFAWTREETVNADADHDEEDKLPIKGIALAFYQTGEKYLLLEDDILDLTGGDKKIRVTYTDNGEERAAILTVTAKANAIDPTDGVTQIGYSYTIDEADRGRAPSFGDWPGQQRVKIEPVAAFSAELPTTIMLKVLLSGQGVGTNSATYDVLPFGYNLGTDEVDVASFEGFSVPSELSKWSLVVTGEESAHEFLGPMARAIGAAIVTRLNPDTGRRVLALVPATLERSLDSAATITNGDIVAGARPVSETDDEIFNVYKVQLFDPITGEERSPSIVFRDVPSVDEHGETKPIELPLKGLVIEADSHIEMQRVLMPMINTLREQFAQARRVYRFGLPMAKSILLDPGQIITVTADDARSSTGARGITSLPVRVLEIEQGWWEEGSTVKVVSYGLQGTGWAPAMKVAAVVDPQTVEVETNEYTSATHPITGATQRDVDFFAVNDPVDCIPRGDFASRVATTITSIAGTTVQFAANHKLAQGDTIRPREYDAASTAHKTYAYAGDANDTLGAANDPAYDIT